MQPLYLTIPIALFAYVQAAGLLLQGPKVQRQASDVPGTGISPFFLPYLVFYDLYQNARMTVWLLPPLTDATSAIRLASAATQAWFTRWKHASRIHATSKILRRLSRLFRTHATLWYVSSLFEDKKTEDESP